jgi:predicted molibdopterin-dependent oxidoreductase YjgC
MRRQSRPPAIHVSSDLALEKSISDGDRVRISTDAGSLEGTAMIDGNLHAGTVWMSHGWLDRNVNVLFTTRNVDHLTIQPYFSAIPLSIERIGAPRS